MHILLVDDHAPMRALVRSLLEHEGMRVDECGDGLEALRLYPQVHPDWVVMDLAMGSLDGIAATRRLRALAPEARIVILTEFDADALRAAARSAGALGYVTKERLFTLLDILTPAAGKEFA